MLLTNSDVCLRNAENDERYALERINESGCTFIDRHVAKFSFHDEIILIAFNDTIETCSQLVTTCVRCRI
jgi:hypothetical protein